KLEKKIRLLNIQIADAERRLKTAEPHDRTIIEVGIKAMRDASITIQRRLDRRTW
ncbi:hypothetical protein LCGC14_0319070, partial [marine sediment metagenome]